MITDIFPLKIYKTKYTGDIEALKAALLPKFESVFNATVADNQGSMRGDGLCSYNVVRDLFTWPEIKPYLDFLNQEAAIYWKELGYYETGHKIFEMWANKYTTGSFIDVHNHAPIPITASFYLQKSKNSGNIAFENPLSTILKHQPVGFKNRSAYATLFDYEVDVEEGDLVMFPGWLNHKTLPNQDTSDRIIIGTNIV